MLVEQATGDLDFAAGCQDDGGLLSDFLLQTCRLLGRLVLSYLEKVEIVLESRQRAAVGLCPPQGLIAGVDRIRRGESNFAFVIVPLVAKPRKFGFAGVELLTPQGGETLKRGRFHNFWASVCNCPSVWSSD